MLGTMKGPYAAGHPHRYFLPFKYLCVQYRASNTNLTGITKKRVKIECRGLRFAITLMISLLKFDNRSTACAHLS